MRTGELLYILTLRIEIEYMSFSALKKIENKHKCGYASIYQQAKCQ